MWRPEPSSARGIDRRGIDKHIVQRRGTEKRGVNKHGRNSVGHRLEKRPERHRVNASSRPGGGPLTAFGVSIVLAGACIIGASLDLLLVSTAAWGLTALFLAACAYAAAKVRRSDWYSAVVGPPLAFACSLLLVAAFSPHDMGSGLMGTVATILELLAFKARAVFLGTVLALCVTLARRLPFTRP